MTKTIYEIWKYYEDWDHIHCDTIREEKTRAELEEILKAWCQEEVNPTYNFTQHIEFYALAKWCYCDCDCVCDGWECDDCDCANEDCDCDGDSEEEERYSITVHPKLPTCTGKFHTFNRQFKEEFGSETYTDTCRTCNMVRTAEVDGDMNVIVEYIGHPE